MPYIFKFPASNGQQTKIWTNKSLRITQHRNKSLRITSPKIALNAAAQTPQNSPKNISHTAANQLQNKPKIAAKEPQISPLNRSNAAAKTLQKSPKKTLQNRLNAAAKALQNRPKNALKQIKISPKLALRTDETQQQKHHKQPKTPQFSQHLH